MTVTIFLIVCCFVMIGSLIWMKLKKVINRKRRDDEPPLVPGHKLFGNAVQFQENAVGFLLHCAKSVGRIFTLRLLHHHMTIVMDVHAYMEFCKNEAFDFDPIQKQVNWNVFRFAINNPRTVIRESAKTVRGKQMKPTLSMFCKRMNEAIAEDTAVTCSANGSEGWKQDGLRIASCNTMFSSIFYTLFGVRDKHSTFNHHGVHVLLTKFHRYFNYLWMGLPIQLFPEANKTFQTMMSVSPAASELLSKDDVFSYIRTSARYMLETGQTDEDVRKHNLVLLHVNYNTYRVTFWALYHLLVYSEAREAVKKEIDAFLSTKLHDGRVEISTEDFAALPILDSFIKETFRVSSGVFMVRGVTKDTNFSTSDGQEYFIRKGDKIAIYPPAIHYDPEIFAQPEKFVYDRFIDATFFKDGREVRNPLMAFGSLCPGQAMAIMQLKLFLLAWCSQIEVELLPGEQTTYDKTCYGHEILPPQNDVQIRYRRVANIEFEFDVEQ